MDLADVRRRLEALERAIDKPGLTVEKRRELYREWTVFDEVRTALEKLEGLHHQHDEGTLGTDEMEAPIAPSDRGAAVSAAKSKNKARFVKALHRRGSSPPQWAREQTKPKIDVEVVKSWLKKPGHGGRPCPRFWADKVADEFVDDKGKSEVPAVSASWPNGIREP